MKEPDFEAPFFVPPVEGGPDGITLRVIASDLSTGNAGIDQATYSVLSERLPPKPAHPPAAN